MDRFRLRLQVAVLAIGTAFAWYTLADDYRRFFSAGGRVFEWSGCVVTNPLVTPCFYGAWIFVAALAVSMWILRGHSAYVGRKEHV